MSGHKPIILVLMSESEARRFKALAVLIERFSFYFASNPDLACQIVDDKRPDLLLFGAGFNSQTNHGNATFIKAFSRTHYLPVVVWGSGIDAVDKAAVNDEQIDDFIASGHDERTCIAVLLAVLRRTRPATISERSETAGLIIDESQRRVSFHGKEIPLAATQFRILAALIDEPSNKMTRDLLIRRVWGFSASVEDRTVDQNVARLRNSLRANGAGNLIKAVRGFGYQVTI